MVDLILVQIQIPPGYSHNHDGRFEISPSSTVAETIAELAKTCQIPNADEYLLFYSASPSRKWLEMSQLILYYDIHPASVLELKHRYQLIHVNTFLASSYFSQELLIDVLSPLSLFLPFAQKKFQLKASSSPNDYKLLYGETLTLLPLNSSLFNLDLSTGVEFFLSSKNVEVSDMLRNLQKRASHLKIPTRCQGHLQMDKKKRWAIAAGNLLITYRSKEESYDKNPIGTIDLNKYSLFVGDKDKKCTVELLSVNSRKDGYQIKFNSLEDSTRWINHFKLQCAHIDDVQHGRPDSNPAMDHGQGLYFGAPIESVITDEKQVPYLVEECIKWIDKRALDVEGIFRLSGSQTEIDSIKAKFNQGTLVDLSTTVEDPHTITGLLKCYFRDLPEPLLLYPNYDKLLEAQSKQDPRERISKLGKLILSLPPVNRATLKYLVEFLSRVEKHSDSNKMAIHNLATVFAPNLIRPLENNVFLTVQDTPLVNGLMTMIIRYCDHIFYPDQHEITFTLGKVIQNFDAQYENQLSLKVDEMVKIYRDLGSDQWIYGEIDHRFGLCPISHIDIAGITKKQQFLAEMEQVKGEIEGSNIQIESLELKKAQLIANIESTKEIENKAGQESIDLKRTVSSIINETPELSNLYSEIEQLYSYFEQCHKSKAIIQQNKADLLDGVSLFKKSLQSDQKIKKFKDQFLDQIDSLLFTLKQEQNVRTLVDERSDTCFKDLTDLRILIGCNPPSPIEPS